MRFRVFGFMLCIAMVALMLVPIHAYEAEVEDEPVVFTFEEARQMVIGSVLAVRDIDNTLREMQNTRRDLNSYLRRLREALAHERLIRVARRDLNEHDRTVQGLRLQQEQAVLSAELNLHRTIATMAENEARIKTLEADIGFAQDSVRRTAILHEHGLASDRTLSAARYAYTTQQAGLEELLRGQYNIRQSLNALLGQPLYQYTVIEFDATLPQFPADLDRHIQTLVQQSPTIQSLQIELNRALDERWVYTGNTRDITISNRDRQRAWEPTSPAEGPAREPSEEILQLRYRLSLQEAVERATIELDQATHNLEATIRRGFSDFNNLQTQADALYTQLNTAIKP